MEIPKTKCKTCIGCSKQEMDNFKEVYRCENFIDYFELNKKLRGEK